MKPQAYNNSVICSIFQLIRSDRNKLPAPYRWKFGQFQNPNKIEHFVKSTKNQLEKSEKEKMKMSDKLYNMHRKTLCVNFQIVKIFIFSSFSYSFRLISAWPVRFFSSVPLLVSFACYNNSLKFPCNHPTFILSLIL